MKKLLCPIDFSEVSLNALEFAVAIGEKEKSELTIINIFTRSDFNKIVKSEDVEEEYEHLRGIAENNLKTISKEILKISQPKGLQSCEYILKSGKIVDKLADISVKQKCELIVLGTTGHSAYERKYLGGKSMNIIQHTSCPVLCVPEGHTFHGINKIVYATDYQEEDKLALQQLIGFCKVLQADLEVLHVSHHNDSIDKAMFSDFRNELSSFINDTSVSYNRVVFKHVAKGLDEYMKEWLYDLPDHKALLEKIGEGHLKSLNL